MIRLEIYNAIEERLRAELGDAVKHFDLWNHNVEFLEMETPWARPAVFVEFGEIDWQHLAGCRRVVRAEGTVSLHIVTDWASGSKEVLSETFDLAERVRLALNGLADVHFHSLQLLSSITNHNHEELWEHIEKFGFIGVKELNQKPFNN